MSLTSGLLVLTGVMAILYGIALLWSVAAGNMDQEQEDWLKSDEVRGSRFNNFENLRYLIKGSRSSIRFGRSKGRGYAMLAIGLLLLIYAFI